ncbi:hypothetical protein AAKU52_000981 [Pedobacter sp. CG_S7]
MIQRLTWMEVAEPYFVKIYLLHYWCINALKACNLLNRKIGGKIMYSNASPH